jgi:predicted AAA+ superfamily ATPase
MYHRLSKPLFSNSFFLFGARGSGKSSLLKTLFAGKKGVLWLDFLQDDLYRALLGRPEQFREWIEAEGNNLQWVVCDEVQRVPSVLNAVHSAIEEKGLHFALTGSSARKLKRGAANLLAGRAFLNNLHPLTHSELGNDFDLDKILQWGSLPKIFSFSSDIERKEYLRSYVNTYLRQEIKEEQVVRQLDPFVRFLEVAAQQNCKIMNASKVARDARTDPKAVLRYFEILQDTLIAFTLEPYHRSIRKIQTEKAKFYIFDLGIKRALEGTLDSQLKSGTSAYGDAFEHFFIAECRRLADYQRREDRFYYLRTKDDVEIDLIIERSRKETWAIEIKSSENVDTVGLARHEKIIADLKPNRWIIASREKRARKIGNAEILPWRQVIEELYPN